MSHRWEFGDEYQELSSKFRKAKKENDKVTLQLIKPRLDELNKMLWQSEVDGFPELAPYSALYEALDKFCQKNNLPFPDLDDRKKNYAGKGDWREINRYFFGVGNSRRSIQIMPLDDRGYIDIEIYDNEICYKGKATSIEDSAVILSKWYMQECSIDELHEQFPGIPNKPFVLTEPRVTYK